VGGNLSLDTEAGAGWGAEFNMATNNASIMTNSSILTNSEQEQSSSRLDLFPVSGTTVKTVGQDSDWAGSAAFQSYPTTNENLRTPSNPLQHSSSSGLSSNSFPARGDNASMGVASDWQKSNNIAAGQKKSVPNYFEGRAPQQPAAAPVGFGISPLDFHPPDFPPDDDDDEFDHFATYHPSTIGGRAGGVGSSKGFGGDMGGGVSSLSSLAAGLDEDFDGFDVMRKNSIPVGLSTDSVANLEFIDRRGDRLRNQMDGGELFEELQVRGGGERAEDTVSTNSLDLHPFTSFRDTSSRGGGGPTDRDQDQDSFSGSNNDFVMVSSSSAFEFGHDSGGGLSLKSPEDPEVSSVASLDVIISTSVKSPTHDACSVASLELKATSNVEATGGTTTVQKATGENGSSSNEGSVRLSPDGIMSFYETNKGWIRF